MADDLGKKISELPETTDLQGLYTIGTDKNTSSKKVSLEFLRQAADYANAQGDYAKSVGDTVAGNVGATDYPVFSASGVYAIGDVVRYADRLYRFTAPHQAGAWNGADVELTSINEEAQRKVSELESETNTKISDLESRQHVYTLKGEGNKYVEIHWNNGIDGNTYRIYFYNTTWTLPADITGIKLGIYAESKYVTFSAEDTIPPYIDVPYTYSEGSSIHALSIGFRGIEGSELKFSIENISAIKDLESETNTKISELKSETNTKISELESETNTKISELESETNTKISELEEDVDNIIADGNTSDNALAIADDNGKVLAVISEDGIKTKKFDSKNIVTVKGTSLIFNA